MKIFVLRRGETQPLGPLTAAEVAEMRIRWQISDADYFRADGASRWKLIGDLSPLAARRRKRRTAKFTGIASLALLGILAIVLGNRPHPAGPQDPAASLAAGLPAEAEQPLPETPALDLVPAATEPAGVPLSDQPIEGNI